MDPQKGMGYWLLESMGYGHKIPANQPGSHENVWVTGEYGLSGVWIIGELTVPLSLEKLGVSFLATNYPSTRIMCYFVMVYGRRTSGSRRTP